MQSTLRTEQASAKRLHIRPRRGGSKFANHVEFALLKQRLQVERPMELKEASGKHAGGGTNRVVPIDLAEHHIPRENHQLSCRFSLGTDRQAISLFVHQQRLNQSRTVEVASIGNTCVKTIAFKVIHLVDVDRAGQD